MTLTVDTTLLQTLTPEYQEVMKHFEDSEVATQEGRIGAAQTALLRMITTARKHGLEQEAQIATHLLRDLA